MAARKNENSSKPYEFSFQFEEGDHKGEKYIGTIAVCSNPLCPCWSLGLTMVSDLSEGSDLSDERKRYNFSLDLEKERLSLSENKKLSKPDRNFARAFSKALKEEEWKKFRDLYYTHKVHITENCDLETLEPQFPEFEIEHEQGMVGYNEIFPFAKGLSLTDGDTEFGIDDQYCLNSTCGCREAGLVIIYSGKPGDGKGVIYTLVRYDYRKNSWSLEDESMELPYSVDEIMKKLRKAYPNIGDFLKKRHRILRALYAKSREKKEALVAESTNQKVGRNDPCPCGSGKKYKKCCGR